MNSMSRTPTSASPRNAKYLCVSLRLAHEEADAQKKNAQEILGFEEKILIAQGGVVEESRPESQMTVGLDYGLVLKHISAHPDFGRVIVKHLDLSRKSASAALGIGK
jgi:hypothetical protein